MPALQDDRPINEYYQLRKLFPDKTGLQFQFLRP
jgi:hypothetical protein